MGKKSAYQQWEDEWKKELSFWGSEKGRELQLCLVAQGYRNEVFMIWMRLLASGFSAIEIMKQIEEELNTPSKPKKKQ